MRGTRFGFGGFVRLAIVAAAAVGFAVGDAQATPARQAATIGSASASRAASDFEWGWDLAPGKTLAIKGVNGWIHVERAAGARTEVRAVKTARRSNPDEVKIEVVPGPDGVTICAVYPGGWGRRNSCEAGEGGHNHVDNNDVQVNFTVRLAAGVRCAAKTVNGEITAEALDSPLEARTVNGSIEVASARPVSAKTVNGSIHAEMGTLGRDDLEFATVNGSITLAIGGRVNARVQASTLNGDIDSDFPLTVKGRFGRHHLDGTIGQGGPEIRASTVNGAIRLRQAGRSL